MEHIEHKALATFHTPPRLWLRYVDDTYVIIDKNMVHAFHTHLNTISPTIAFTMETEKNDTIAFLDVAITRQPDQRLSTSIYKKPTNTDRYLHYTSHHPRHQKLTVAKTLYARATTHIKDTVIHKHECKNIARVLKNNGFPRNLHHMTHNTTTSQNRQFKSFTCLP
uniref:Uncharacterized protein LOC108950552 n=1 Tax=Phallusia mammillata TaxID=59560 RepID=A0A6F9DJJ3_9ASCI|nr:uncharacterized protein LOC108950552 [Phallusia mammillata]